MRHDYPAQAVAQSRPSARISAAIAGFTAGTSLSDVPAPVEQFSRLLLLDTFGALLGGLRYPQVRRLGSELADAEPAAGGFVFSRLMTLGTAATWLDADSGGSFHPQGHRLPPVPTAHPAPHVLPVLLHEAAWRDTDDRRLLEVFTLATEVGMRSGVASSLRPGLHPHGVHGPGAAAIAAALLSGVPSDRVGEAFLLGSCLPLAATLDVPMRGGTIRNAWTGLGAYYGAIAAQRVAAGARCDDAPYLRLFDGAVCTDFDENLVIEHLGRRWALLDSYLKPYACARWIHPALDAARAALVHAGVPHGPGSTAPEGLRAGEVEHIDVDTFAFAASLSAVDIGSDMQARFSLPYSLAALMVDGVLHSGGFLPERLARQDVADLARRVVVREAAEMTAGLPGERPATVTVYLRDGRIGRASVRNARGNPGDPLSTAEVIEKFRGNVGELLSAEAIDEVVIAVLASDRSDLVGPQPAQPLTHVLARLARTLVPT